MLVKEEVHEYFLEDDEAGAQFDVNAEQYKQKTIDLANRLEDLTKVSFWATKPKFCTYDYHLCKNNDPREYFATATTTLGCIPVWYDSVDAVAELKYRNVHSNQYPDTLLDKAKMKALKSEVRDGTKCYVIWAFRDCDMFYEVDLDHKFFTILGRNTYTTKDLPHEFKPQILIPMNYLAPVEPGMFEVDDDF